VTSASAYSEWPRRRGQGSEKKVLEDRLRRGGEKRMDRKGAEGDEKAVFERKKEDKQGGEKVPSVGGNQSEHPFQGEGEKGESSTGHMSKLSTDRPEEERVTPKIDGERVSRETGQRHTRERYSSYIGKKGLVQIRDENGVSVKAKGST